MNKKFTGIIAVSCALSTVVLGYMLHAGYGSRADMSGRAAEYVRQESLAGQAAADESTHAGIAEEAVPASETEAAVIPPVVSADITVGSIFETAREIDGILTLNESLSDEARLVAGYFQDKADRFIILEIKTDGGEEESFEFVPGIVGRTGAATFYNIICDDISYVAVVADGEVQYEEEKEQE